MLVADAVLGNVATDADLRRERDRRPAGEIERVVLDERDRRRSRIRTTTDAGTDIGIVIEEERGLRPGDVLVADADRFVVVEFADRPALVVAPGGGDATAMARAVEFGHAVGNRHRDLAVRDDEVLIALDADAERIVDEVTALLPPDTETRRERVDPTLFDGTGGHGAHDHDHGAHDHDHGGHKHDHDGHDHGSHGHDHGGHEDVGNSGIQTLDDGTGEGSQ